MYVVWYGQTDRHVRTALFVPPGLPISLRMMILPPRRKKGRKREWEGEREIEGEREEEREGEREKEGEKGGK